MQPNSPQPVAVYPPDIPPPESPDELIRTLHDGGILALEPTAASLAIFWGTCTNQKTLNRFSHRLVDLCQVPPEVHPSPDTWVPGDLLDGVLKGAEYAQWVGWGTEFEQRLEGSLRHFFKTVGVSWTRQPELWRNYIDGAS